MTGTVAGTRSSIPARQIAAVVVGNALEFYDFLTYAYFAVYIGRAFFPSNDPSASLLASLGTFGVGYFMRPIGGLLIGRMGDRLGRKPAMLLSFWLMGIGIAGLALTPPYASIGVAAPLLVIFFRLLQGFALGGEVGPATAFLLEAAPAERRGFYASFQIWTQSLSTLVSGLVGLGLASALSERQLQTFGWRIAFLLGAAIVPFGLMMRRNLPETFRSAGNKSEHVPLRPYLLVAVLGLMLLTASIGTSVMNYMTTYALTTLHMRANVAFAATVVVGLSGIAFNLLGGALSDRIGRKPAMLVPTALLLVFILPAFYVIAHYRTTAALLAATALLASLRSLYSPIPTVWLTESLPPAIRCAAVGLVYAVSISLFGGTTQYVVTWLIKVSGNPLAPAWYWTGATIIGLAAMCVIRESVPRRLAKSEPGQIQLLSEIAEQP